MSTELDDESPEFTLTCTTYGGQGTVWWTRDSYYISGGNSESDSRTRYKHTLTVRARRGGDYRCNLEVVDGDDQWRSLNVRGKCDDMAVHIHRHLEQNINRATWGSSLCIYPMHTLIAQH